MNKQELIEKIEARHVCDLAVSDSFKNGFNTMKEIAVDLASELEEPNKPQAEKVEVPDFVAEFIEVGNRYDKITFLVHQKYLGINSVMKECPVKDWLRSVDYETVLSLFNGYTVKPKRWVVKNKDHIGLESFVNSTINPVWTTEEPLWMTFTDKAKAEAVATLVEGTVEEV